MISYCILDDIKIEVSPKSEMPCFSLKGKKIRMSQN